MDDARGDTPVVAQQPLDLTPMLQMLSQDMDALTRHADTKAQIILAINAILTATASGQATGLTAATPLQFAAFACGVATLVLMIASVYFSLRTVVPRQVPPRAQPARNLFFYGDIAALGEDDYIRQFAALSMPEVRTQVLAQVHSKAAVVGAKFRSVRQAVSLLFAAVTVWLVGRILTTLL